MQKEKRETRVSFMLRPKEFAKLKKEAENRDQSVSSLVRSLVLKGLEK